MSDLSDYKKFIKNGGTVGGVYCPPAQAAPTTAPVPAPGPHGDVEQAFREWIETKSPLISSPAAVLAHDGFKAGAEWAAPGTGMTFEEWWKTAPDGILALGKEGYEMAYKAGVGRTPEVQAVLDCAKAYMHENLLTPGEVSIALCDAVMDLERVDAGREREKGVDDDKD